MKKNFGAMASMVLSLLGLEKFARDDKNKVVLSDEEREKVKADYGEKFLTKLLEIENSDSKATEEQTEYLYSAMKEHILADAKKDFENAEKKAADEKAQLESEKKELEQKLASKEQAINVLSSETEDLPKPEVNDIWAAKAKRKKGDVVMKVNMEASHYAAIQAAVQTGVFDFSTARLDAVDLQREADLYLGGFNYQTNVEIFSKIIGASPTLKEMRPVFALETYKAAEGQISSVMQSFIAKWTGNTNINLKRVEIKNFHHKINVKVTPHDVFDDYLAHLLDEGLSPSQQPMVAWIIDNLILPALNDDLEYRAIAKGKFVETELDAAGVVTAGGKPEDSMDGFETLLVEGKAAGTEVSGYHFFPDAKTMDELIEMMETPGEIVKYVQAYTRWISPKFKTIFKKIYLGPELKEMYKQDYAALNGASSYLQSTQFAKDEIDFTNKMLVELPSMTGSPIMFATPEKNFVYLRWKNLVPQIINDIQKQDYDVKFFGEFRLGAGFPIANYVFASVPDGYDPKAQVEANEGVFTDYKTMRPSAAFVGGESDEGDAGEGA